MGSEEFIRLQFEEYLLALLSSMKYHEELSASTTGELNRSRTQFQNYNIEGDPATDFNLEFLTQWQTTSNYAMFSRLTSDALLFSITEPRHPSAGGLTMEDIQRRVSQQVADLHLDERVREGREALNRHFSTGQKKVTAAFNSFWSDIESMREAQRKRNEEKAIQAAQAQSQRTSIETPTSPTPSSSTSTMDTEAHPRASVDMTQAQASVSAASQKAGAYFSSWGSWASEKRREWQDKRSSSPSPSLNTNTTAAASSNANANASSRPASIKSPSASTLSVVTEIAESDRDRGRGRAAQHKREESVDSTTTNDGGLTRSVSRRKRWSNILLRRDSSEFRRDEPTSDSADVPFPKSPLSQGSPAYGKGTEEKQDQKEDRGSDPKIHTQEKVGLEAALDADVDVDAKASAEVVDRDGFSSVALRPSEGLSLGLDQNQGRDRKENVPPSSGHSRDESLTALPVKEDVS
jgi:hypothetical protein